MQQISLREFRTRGSKSLGTSRGQEPILLAGREGPAYFLVPVVGDVSVEDRELRRALAKASLRAGWLLAVGNSIQDVEVLSEIDAVRASRARRKTPKRR
jgi:hypothetical protein